MVESASRLLLSGLLFACCLSRTVSALDAPLFVYHDHEALTQFLQDVANARPDIAELKSIGKSVEGRDLWVIVLGSSPREHVLLRPDLNLVGNMHGNEAVGREVLVHFIYHLVNNYDTDPKVKALLDNNNFHILTSMNPDGFAKSPEGVCRPLLGRSNANGMDLNRNFPDYFADNAVDRQPETLAVMKWADDNNFVIHSNLHGGALVVNYPYDNFIGGPTLANMSTYAKVSMSRDNDVLAHISRAYSLNHPRMSTIKVCNDTGSDNHYPPDGITNGAAWYPTLGCMQDWFYIFKGALAITLEIACCKHAPADQLETFFDENRDSLIAFYQQADMGVRGVASDSDGQAMAGVQVEIVGRDHPHPTTSLGEYWRILLPGSYTARFSKSCYETREVQFTVPAEGHVTVNVEMVRTAASSGALTSATSSAVLVLAISLLCFPTLNK